MMESKSFFFSFRSGELRFYEVKSTSTTPMNSIDFWSFLMGVNFGEVVFTIILCSHARQLANKNHQHIQHQHMKIGIETKLQNGLRKKITPFLVKVF